MTAFKVLFGTRPDLLEDEMNVLHAKVDTIKNWKIASQDSAGGGGLWIVIEYEPAAEEAETD